MSTGFNGLSEDHSTPHNPTQTSRMFQRARVWARMKSGEQFTLRQLEIMLGDPPQSISARIRDFRKRQFGGHFVERTYLGQGVWGYRLKVKYDG